jgi:hypothetical protein
VRQVAVARLSLHDELANVVRGGAAVVILVWTYLAATLGNADTRRTLLPYQQLVANRPSNEQRMFRELREGLLEAEAVRSMTGAWPSPEMLAADGIPPFAPDPTAKGGAYQWSAVRVGNTINYLGIPALAASPAWLLSIQEPEPGVPPDQTFEDEEHLKMIDGTMLHISTWLHTAGPAVPVPVTPAPQVEGWTQVYAVGPGTGAAAPIMPR